MSTNDSAALAEGTRVNDELLAGILAGLDAATPGPWFVRPLKGYCDDEVRTSHQNWAPDKEHPHRNCVATTGLAGGQKEQRFQADSAHIARLDPDTVRSIITELQARRRSAPSMIVGPEWVLVPREPTPEMLAAWYRYKSGHHFPGEEPPRDTSDYGAYRAMITAAPAPEESRNAG